MNNKAVEQLLNDCTSELLQLESEVVRLGATSPIASYLNKYAVVRACGVIEQAYKTVVADCCSSGAVSQVKEFLRVRVRESSSNPSWDNICGLLKDFDSAWNGAFKAQVGADVDSSQLKQSLKSLVEARNDFAHGGSPTTTIGDAKSYFEHASKIIGYLDGIVR